jgi:hypothetical protein
LNNKAIFLDTSIQIARFFQGSDIKKVIENRISKFETPTTSLIVKQEFKRRVLREAIYLLSTFERFKSYSKVRRWVEDNLPSQQARKRTICLNLLSTIGEIDGVKETDEEISKRSIVYLRALIKYGLEDFEQSVKNYIQASNCACGKAPVIYRNIGLNIGVEKCSKINGECGIKIFLLENIDQLKRIANKIETILSSGRTDKLSRTLLFINSFLENPDEVEKLNPCTIVGDLLIALESKNIFNFYTLNGKESKTLCSCLHQNLYIRPRNYNQDDILFAAELVES